MAADLIQDRIQFIVKTVTDKKVSVVRVRVRVMVRVKTVTDKKVSVLFDSETDDALRCLFSTICVIQEHIPPVPKELTGTTTFYHEVITTLNTRYYTSVMSRIPSTIEAAPNGLYND